MLLARPGTPPNATKTMEFLVGMGSFHSAAERRRRAGNVALAPEPGWCGWWREETVTGGLNNSSAAAPSPPLEPMTGGAG
jgi:hypothetical protein